MSRLALLIAAALALLASAVRGEATKPNFLFIFADDQAYDTLSATGNEEIQTPTLDQLARRGTVFTHCYNQGGWHGAVCVASRTMLTTGCSLWRAKAAEASLKKEFQAKRQTWPQLLEQQGYETYFSGKWHVRLDPSSIFNVTRHVRPGMPKQSKQGYNRPQEGKEDAWTPWDENFGGFWAGGKHWSEVLADDAVDYLDRAAGREAPFFMYLAFNAPHDPRQSPKEYVDRYPLSKISTPQPFYAMHPHEIGSNRIRDEQLAPFPRTEHAVRVNRQEYYAIITHMDHQISRILQALEQSGKADNTYIFFTADHGLSCGHHGLLGKQNMYDHSVRTPCIMVGPQFKAGERIDSPVYVQDVMPTTLALAGAAQPKHVDFQSVLPLLKENAPARGEIYGAYVNTQRMITRGDWKLISYPKIEKQLLFNLREDPLETNDVAEANPEQVKELSAALLKLQQSLDDPLLQTK